MGTVDPTALSAAERLQHLRRAGHAFQHDGVAIGGDDSAVCLTGDLAGFQDQLAAAPVEFFAEVFVELV